jgi:Holliday junction resolvase RusA-like endonuclease
VIHVTLPLPPSTNNLYINLKRGGRAKSAAYNDWLQIARDACLAAYAACGSPDYPPKAKMRLTVRVGATYRRDITNCVKPVEDALCAFLPIPDDRYNDQIVLVRDLNCEGFVVCTLAPLVDKRSCRESSDIVRKLSGPDSCDNSTPALTEKPSVKGDD